jgi:hypothetical protein
MHLSGPSRGIKFLYTPAPPPPKVWALKPPSWALVHKTTYAPMNIHYTALCIMFWMRAYPLLGQMGRGWALEIESFLDPVKWHQADRQVPFGAQKHEMVMHASKTLCRRHVNHRCINSCCVYCTYVQMTLKNTPSGDCRFKSIVK